jgi:hypothetical protein
MRERTGKAKAGIPSERFEACHLGELPGSLERAADPRCTESFRRKRLLISSSLRYSLYLRPGAMIEPE